MKGMKGIKLTLRPDKLLHVGVSIKLNKKHFLAKKKTMTNAR
jgi:hypothetical protein